MCIVLCALAQSVYSYGISAWGGTYEVHLKTLETTINSLIRISFNKPHRTSTDILFKNYNLKTLKQLHAKEILLNLYHLKHSVVTFTHNYHTRQVENNVFRLRKCNTEFGKRDPFNITIEISNRLGINISNYNSFNSYKKYISVKVKSLL